MRASTALIALVLALFHAGTAYADNGVCIELHCSCPDGEKVGSCDTTCDVLCGAKSSSSSSSNGIPPGAAVKLLGAMVVSVVFVFMFAVAPAHSTSLVHKGAPYQTAAEAKEAWKDEQRHLAVLDALGKQLAVEKDQLRDVPKNVPNAPPKQRIVRKYIKFAPPRLVPSLDWECNRAGAEAPFLNGGPIHIFRDEQDMLDRCATFFAPPRDHTPGPVCSADEVTCRPGICCPRSAPYYNPCDEGCYPSTEFRGKRKPDVWKCGAILCAP